MGRLEAIERKHLIKQSLLFFTGGVLTWLIFIFAILPLFSRILAVISKKNFAPTATPSPVVLPPVLEQPFEATNSAQISLKGRATPKMSILLGQNGSLDKKTTSDEGGNFAFNDVTLMSGENLFQAYVEDPSGVRSDGSAEVRITLATDMPKLEITEPQDNTTITARKQQVITIKGKTDGGNKVYLGTQFLFVASDGSFQGSFQLTTGDNLLQVKAVNKAGNETMKEIHVKYMP